MTIVTNFSQQSRFLEHSAMFYSTFNNISIISWRPCLILEKNGVFWETNYLYFICPTHRGHSYRKVSLAIMFEHAWFSWSLILGNYWHSNVQPVKCYSRNGWWELNSISTLIWRLMDQYFWWWTILHPGHYLSRNQCYRALT